MSALLLIAVPLLPLILGVLLLVQRWRGWVITVAATLPLTAFLLLPLNGQELYLPWLLLGTRLGVDPTGTPFLALAAIVWTAAGWHARNHLEPLYRTRFFLFWLLAWAGNLTVFLAFDAVSFYTAFALMSLSAYALVVHRGTAADYRAGRVYLVMVLIGEGLLIAGLIAVGREAGNVDLHAMQNVWRADRASSMTALLLATGFAIKIGLVPLHVWLPLAHPQAPVPASAVLSGVMLKAGLIGWLRFLPIGFEGFGTMGYGIIAAGIFTAFYGAAVGVTQQRPKAVLAYSSVSQMGLMAAGCGLILVTPSQVEQIVGVVGLFALHHGLAKGALFLGVEQLSQHPRVARWLLILPAMSLVGLPLTSGLSAKLALKRVLPESLAWIEILLALSSFLTALILLRFFVLVWPRSAGQAITRPDLGWCLLLLCGFAAPPAYAWWGLGNGLLDDYAPVYLGSALWPVLLAIGLVVAGRRVWRQRWLPTIPEGDLIVLVPWRRLFWRPVQPKRWPAPPRFPLAAWSQTIEWNLTRLSVATGLGAVLLLSLLLAMRWQQR